MNELVTNVIDELMNDSTEYELSILAEFGY